MNSDRASSQPQAAFITGADRGLGFALTELLLQAGWRVFAGQYMTEWPELRELQGRYPAALHLIALDVALLESVRGAKEAVEAQTSSLDLLINNAGVNSPTSARGIREAQDYEEMERLLQTNSLGPLRVVEAFLPLMDRGTFKRLCFVSSEAGSVERAARRSWFGYCMSKSALNMATKLLFNDLRPDGYSFRLYHPGWIKSYISGSKGTVGDMEPEEAAVPALDYFLSVRDDEDRLVLRDWRGENWPW